MFLRQISIYLDTLALAMPPPRCRCRLRGACFCRAAAVLLLPTLPPRCHRRHRGANATTMFPPLPLLCRRLPRRAARRRQAAAALPPPLCRRCHRAATANSVLQTPSPRCLPPPCCPELPMMQGTSALPQNRQRRAMVGGRGHGGQCPWFRC